MGVDVSTSVPRGMKEGLTPIRTRMKVGGMNKYQVGHRLKMFNLLIGIDEEPTLARSPLTVEAALG